MSLFSSVCAAATVGALQRVCLGLGLRPVAAATASLLLAFSPSFWGEANVQRVYALNALFVVLAAGAAFSWHRTREPRRLVLAAFLCGLGATNHTFMAVQAVAIAVFALVAEPALAAKAAGADPGRERLRDGVVTLPLPAAAVPCRSTPRLGKPGDPAGPVASHPPTGLLGPEMARRARGPAGHRRRLRSQPRRRAAVDWGCSRRGRPSRGLAAWLAGRAPAADHGGEPRRSSVPRISHRHLRLAPVLHPVVCHGRPARRHGLPGPAANGCLAASASCLWPFPLWPCFWDGVRSTGVATGLRTTSAGRCFDPCHPARLS